MKRYKAVRSDETSLTNPSTLHSTKPHGLLFAMRLPFDVPVGHGAAFGMRRSEDPAEPPWVELGIFRIKIELRFAALEPYVRGLEVLFGADPDLSDGASRQTWVLARTLNVLFTGEPKETAETQTGGFGTIAFERCLSAVNILTETSRLVIGEIESHPLTKESLDPVLKWFIVDLETGELSEPKEFELHDRPYNPGFTGYDERHTHNELAEAVGRRLETETLGYDHPLLVARALERSAQAQRRRGDATSAILILQTAAETFLRGLHTLLLVDGSLPSGEIEQETTVPFAKLISTALPPLLGGDWSSTRSSVELYRARLYELRNQIIHDGHEPAWFDINPAFDAFDGLRSFVQQQVAKSWRSRPRTLVAMSERWAGGDGQLPTAARPRAEELRAEPMPYWLPPDIAHRLEPS